MLEAPIVLKYFLYVFGIGWQLDSFQAGLID